jgi:hypothetical protein
MALRGPKVHPLDREVIGMTIGKPGDHVVVESAQVAHEPRVGEILEVLRNGSGFHYRVRWSDGHESLFTPTAGSARIVPEEPANV